jgi:hypothetical protein
MAGSAGVQGVGYDGWLGCSLQECVNDGGVRDQPFSGGIDVCFAA